MKRAGDENHLRSDPKTRVDNRGALYSNLRDVYNGPIIKQTVIKKERSVTYSVDKEDVGALEAWSMFLMKHLGLKNTVVSAIVSALIGSGSFLSGLYGPAFLTQHATGLMLFGFAGLFVAASLFAAIQYRNKSRCVKCNTFYAMQEIGKPQAREVRANGGVRRTVTRTYQCKFCGYEVEEVETQFIEDDPESDGR